MNNLAIIPARSGSKGVPDKNIRDLCGKPLIAYSIEAAILSGQFSEVMVSTDSEKYADISRQFGANVPFLRSLQTASDTASSWDMVDEVLSEYDKLGQRFDSFCILQPTSPMRTSEDIKKAYELFYTKAIFAVVSVCEAEHSPLWCGHLPPTLELNEFIDVNSITQRQALGKYYRLNGAIYIVNTEKYMTDHFIYQKGSYAYVMDQFRSVDIDTEIDFALAEVLLKKAWN